MKSVHVVVRGRVQGVGFRWFTQDAAKEHRVTGWVRTRRDGTVEAELHGSDAAVTGVVESISQGPAGARIDEMSVTDATAATVTGFEIRDTV